MTKKDVLRILKRKREILPCGEYNDGQYAAYDIAIAYVEQIDDSTEEDGTKKIS